MKKEGALRLTLIKGTLIAIIFLAMISTSIIVVNTPNLEVATPDENSTSDQATIDEVSTDPITVVLTTIKEVETETTITETIKPTDQKETESIATDSQDKENDKIENENLKYDEAEKRVDNEIETEGNNIKVEYLLNVNNPDSNYAPQSFSLSDSERYLVSCVVMGEFGGGGFTGCALIAQAIRDSMAEYGYSATSAISNMGYYGYNSNPNSNSYEAVDWIFDGNAVVQHRILYMNNSPGGWHGAQKYILDYQGVWFFDKW